LNELDIVEEKTKALEDEIREIDEERKKLVADTHALHAKHKLDAPQRDEVARALSESKDKRRVILSDLQSQSEMFRAAYSELLAELTRRVKLRAGELPDGNGPTAAVPARLELAKPPLEIGGSAVCCREWDEDKHRDVEGFLCPLRVGQVIHVVHVETADDTGTVWIYGNSETSGGWIPADCVWHVAG